jgi:hypothetical protein
MHPVRMRRLVPPFPRRPVVVSTDAVRHPFVGLLPCVRICKSPFHNLCHDPGLSAVVRLSSFVVGSTSTSTTVIVVRTPCRADPPRGSPACRLSGR